mmetsp:Transcript_51992/g.134081  ORF Transcript_51992/g.134081 Transcript_51992/m.134081 type:complete len:311 (+) Transcript_51992:1061-1993(+)
MRDLLVVARARIVPSHAEGIDGILGARAILIEDHRLGARLLEALVRRALEARAARLFGALRARPEALNRRRPLARRGRSHIRVEVTVGQLVNLQGVVVLNLVEGLHTLHVFDAVQRHDVIGDEVIHKAHVALVQLGGELLHVLLGAEVLVNLVPVLRPVPMGAVSTGTILALELLHNRRDPDAIESHALDVVEVLRDTLQRAATPVVVLIVADGLIAVAARKAVDEDEVDALAADLAAPLRRRALVHRQRPVPEAAGARCVQVGLGRMPLDLCLQHGGIVCACGAARLRGRRQRRQTGCLQESLCHRARG